MKKLLAALGLLLWASSSWGGETAEQIKQLRDRDADVRRTAARALGQAVAEAKTVVPALSRALQDPDAYVRRFAAQSLGEMGPAAQAAVPALTMALRDTRKEVQEAAAAALGKIGTSGTASLVATLKDEGKSELVRRRAAEALGQMGRKAHAEVPALVAALKPNARRPGRGQPDIRLEVVTALAAIAEPGDKGALEALREIASNKKERNRTLKKAASEAVRQIQRR